VNPVAPFGAVRAAAAPPGSGQKKGPTVRPELRDGQPGPGISVDQLVFLAPHGLHGFLAPHGLHGFFAPHGLHGFFAPHGLHGFFAPHGLHGFFALQGLHAAICTGVPPSAEAATALGNTTADVAKAATLSTLTVFFNIDISLGPQSHVSEASAEPSCPFACMRPAARDWFEWDGAESPKPTQFKGSLHIPGAGKANQVVVSWG